MQSWQLPFPPPCGSHRFARGLELRVHERGASWILRYTYNGKRREHGLGAFLATTPEQAERALAAVLSRWEVLRAEIDAGNDPIEIKATKRQSAKVEDLRRRSGTLLKVSRQYYEACVEPVVSEKYARDWVREFEGDIPVWLLNKPAEDVVSDDVLRAIAEMPASIGDRVNKARQRLEQVCEWMIRHRKVTSNAAAVRRNTRTRWQNRFDLGVPCVDRGAEASSSAA